MPFKSKAQRRLFYAKADRGEIPTKIVKRWEKETPKGAPLPEKVAFWQGFKSQAEKVKTFVKNPDPVTWGVLGAGAGAGLGAGGGKIDAWIRSPQYLRFKQDYRERHPKAKEDEIQSEWIRKNTLISAGLLGAAGAFYGKAFKDINKFRGGTGGWHHNPRPQGPMSGASLDQIKKLLGVTGSETTKAEVLKKYRDAARKAHPDVGGSNEKMQQINSAIEELKKDSWFQKLAFFLDGSGQFFSGIGKGSDRSNLSTVNERSGTIESPTTDKTLLDRERNPRSYNIEELGPMFEAEDGSHVKY